MIGSSVMGIEQQGWCIGGVVAQDGEVVLVPHGHEQDLSRLMPFQRPGHLLQGVGRGLQKENIGQLVRPCAAAIPQDQQQGHVGGHPRPTAVDGPDEVLVLPHSLFFCLFVPKNMGLLRGR